ncbi:MAG: hypothetical protein LBV22_03240 [Mycoplasmataceae bacterium]|jgi:alanine dehydrogenase|nr:hypothetical protein [Mycoplasmataceae bacterium]
MLKLIILTENKKENRVSFVPTDIKRISKIFDVYIQSGAGLMAGFNDQDYETAGAKIFISQKAAIPTANFIFKLSKLTSKELKLVRPNQVIFANPCLIANPTYLKTILKKSLTVVALELLQTPNNSYEKISGEIKGKFGALAAAFYNSKLYNKNSVGKAITGQNNFLVVNYSITALTAIKTLLALGVNVTLLEQDQNLINNVNSDQTIKDICALSNAKLSINNSSFETLITLSKGADAIINTTNGIATKTKLRITYDMVTNLHKGGVYIDLAAEQGFGSDITSKFNLFKKPINTINGITCCVLENIPSLYPQSLSIAISQIYADLLISTPLENIKNPMEFVVANINIHRAVMTSIKDNHGIIVNAQLAQTFNLKLN